MSDNKQVQNFGKDTRSVEQLIAQVKDPMFRIKGGLAEFSQNRVYGRFGVYGSLIGGNGQLQAYDMELSVVLKGQLGVGLARSCLVLDSSIEMGILENSVLANCRIKAATLTDCAIENCQFDGESGPIELVRCEMRNCLIPSNVKCVNCQAYDCIVGDLQEFHEGSLVRCLVLNFEVIGDNAEMFIVHPNVRDFDEIEKWTDNDYRYALICKRIELGDERVSEKIRGLFTQDKDNVTLFGPAGIFRVVADSQGKSITGPIGIAANNYVLELAEDESKESEPFLGEMRWGSNWRTEDIISSEKKEVLIGGIMPVGTKSLHSFRIGDRTGSSWVELFIDGRFNQTEMQGEWPEQFYEGKLREYCTVNGIVWNLGMVKDLTLRQKMVKLDKAVEKWRQLTKSCADMARKTPELKSIVLRKVPSGESDAVAYVRNMIQLCSSSGIQI